MSDIGKTLRAWQIAEANRSNAEAAKAFGDGADEIERLEDLVEGCSRRNESDADKIAELEAKIEAAPHGSICQSRLTDDGSGCNCWKSRGEQA